MRVSELKSHPFSIALYGEQEPGDGLKDSIATKGILEPLVVKEDGTIISGHRRWQAAMALEMSDVPCRIVSYDSILDEQEAIIEFNRQRVKTFTQKMAEAERLKEIEAERARKRKLATLKQGDTLPEVATLPQRAIGKTRDKVSESIGMKPRTYSKAAQVWEAAKQGDETASKLIEKLDKGQTTINAAYKQVVVQNEKRAAIEAIETAPLEGEYHVIVVDPPWQYEKRNEDPSHRGRCPYPTMTVEEICSLEIPSAPDCVLWLWSTNAFMHDAFHVLEAWGFQPKTILTWVKDRMGTGDWLRGQTEHCIMAIKGKPVVNLTNQTTALHGPLREHSRKPEEFYSLVEALCPGQKLEMFARSERRGWVVHGNELGRFSATA